MTEYAGAEPSPWSMMERHELISRLVGVSQMHQPTLPEQNTCLVCGERCPCSTLVVSMGVKP